MFSIDRALFKTHLCGLSQGLVVLFQVGFMVESGKSIRNEQGVFMMIQSVYMSHRCYPKLHCSSNISYDKKSQASHAL